MTNLLISLFIKDKENVKDAKVRNAYGKMAGIVGICCNIFLFATKFFAGIITGAISITADAFNNLSDAALLLSHLSDLEWLENQQMKIIHSDMEGWNMYQDLLYLS